MQFWKANARRLNNAGKSLDRKTFYEVSLFADASSNGYGGYKEMHENNPEEENGICGVHVDRAVPELSCGPPDVGIIRSMEKDREIPLEGE